MEMIEFPEQTVIIAKDQPEYRPAPAHQDCDGRATFCWALTWRERWMVFFTGRLWHQILTFNKPLQPQLLLTRKPNLARRSTRPKEPPDLAGAGIKFVA